MSYPRLRGPPSGGARLRTRHLSRVSRRLPLRCLVITQHRALQRPVGSPAQSSAQSTVSHLLIATSPPRRSRPQLQMRHWRTVGWGCGRPKMKPGPLPDVRLEILTLRSPHRPPRSPSHPARLQQLRPPRPPQHRLQQHRPPRQPRPHPPLPTRLHRPPQHRPPPPRHPRPPQHSPTYLPRPEDVAGRAGGQLSRLQQRHPPNSWSCRMAPPFHASPVSTWIPPHLVQPPRPPRPPQLPRHLPNSWSCRMAPSFHAPPVCTWILYPRPPHQPPRPPRSPQLARRTKRSRRRRSQGPVRGHPPLRRAGISS